MPPVEPQSDADVTAEAIAAAWDRVRVGLETRRHQIYEEIRTYPTPIAGCDQQFNYLLGARAGVEQEIERLEEIRSESPVQPGARERIERFINTCAYINEGEALHIRSCLKKECARQEK